MDLLFIGFLWETSCSSFSLAQPSCKKPSTSWCHQGAVWKHLEYLPWPEMLDESQARRVFGVSSIGPVSGVSSMSGDVISPPTEDAGLWPYMSRFSNWDSW